ncbi:hypothetical protein ACP3P8_26045 [Pseudomonas aeruginosa]
MFVQALANGDYIDLPGDALQLMAEGVIARHNRQLEAGYDRAPPQMPALPLDRRA